jgi:hypothetical protein
MKLYDFKEFTGTKKFNIFSVFTADDFRQCHPKLQFLKPCGCM